MKNALQLLQMLRSIYDLKDMGPEFRGTHHITIDREIGCLTVNVWTLGRCWPIHIKEEDLEKTPDILLRDVVDLLNAKSES